MKFIGYIRPDGSVGIRNHLLIVPNGRNAVPLAMLIGKLLRGAKVFPSSQEGGRTSEDRTTLARVSIGLAKNPNVGAVLVVGMKRAGNYPELSHDKLVGEMEKSGKPIDSVYIDGCGGMYQAIAEGMRKGRALMLKASEVVRQEVDFGKLFIGVKCGYSDGTSGLAGNPVVGNLFDRLVAAGGSASFGETTEVIGAEHILAKRFVDDVERERFFAVVNRVEEEAKATGEDIRSINPIPANIAAGLSTLEEKSLGAIAKAGTQPLQQCLKYGEQPVRRGLHYMDAWMSSSSIFLGHAAAGAVLNIFQVGGGWMPKGDSMSTMHGGLITPLLYMTGNPRCWENVEEELDFNASTVITAKESIADAGERLSHLVCHIASGKMTKVETLDVDDPVEVYYRGPGL